MAARYRVLLVVQRYGDVAGGAEAHARQLARKLAARCDIEVATTTARDYRTWENSFTAGLDEIDGVPVRRFPVARPRARDFRRWERRAFAPEHSLADERRFVEAQGPYCPELLEHVWRAGRDVDVVLFFTYIYYPTVYGVPLVPERAVLVPTAHEEPALGLTVYRALFHAPRAIAYNTAEERAMVWRRFRNRRVPSEVVGVGVDVPADRSAERFRARYGLEGPLLLYVGRIVESKGCAELFDQFACWRESDPRRRATLVLAGHAEMPVPLRDDVRHLGYLSDADKFDALAACDLLVVPSRLESLSMVTLEAWSCERPTLCHAASPVLASLARRSGGGLAYRTFAEFGGLLDRLLADADLRRGMGELGREFVARTYTWTGVVEKYLDIFAEVRARNA